MHVAVLCEAYHDSEVYGSPNPAEIQVLLVAFEQKIEKQNDFMGVVLCQEQQKPWCYL